MSATVPPRSLTAEELATAHQLSTRIRETYRAELQVFKHAMFRHEDPPLDASPLEVAARSPRMSLNALSVPRLRVSVIATLGHHGEVGMHDLPPGTGRLLISVAGHKLDREGQPVSSRLCSVPAVEATAWVLASVGADLLPYMHSAGRPVEVVYRKGSRPKPGALYYMVFIGASGLIDPPPGQWATVPLLPHGADL